MHNLTSTLELISQFPYCATELDEAVSRIFFQIQVNSTTLLSYIGYWRRLWSSDDFVGQTLANCVEVLHADIIGVWNLPDKDDVCLLFSS